MKWPRSLSFVLLFLWVLPLAKAQHIDIHNLEPYYDSLDTYRSMAQTSNDTLFLAQYHFFEATMAEYKYNIDTIAINHYLKSQAMFSALKDTMKVVNVNSSLGNIYINNGMYQEALDIFNEVLEFHKAHNELGLQAHNYSSLANVYHHLGQFDREGMALDSAEVMVQDSFLLGIIMFQRIRRLLQVEDFEGGLEKVSIALPIIEENNWEIHSRFLLMHARCYEGLGQTTRSIIQARKAVEIAEKYGQIEALSIAECLLSDLYAFVKDYEEALVHSQKCNALKDSTFRAEKETLTNELLVRMNDEKVALEKRELEEDRDLKASQLVSRSRLAMLMGLGFLSLLIIGMVLRKNYQERIKSAHVIQEKQEELHSEVLMRMETENKYKHSVALLEGQEKERKRMSQDLHDGVGGVLAAVRMNLDKHLGSGTENLKPVKDAISGIGHAIQEIRTIARNTLPESLLKGGLVAALEDYISSFSHLENVSIELKAYDRVDLSEEKSVMVYRILQELIYNAVKHSECSHIEVIILREGEVFNISVSDDGKGFDPKTVERAGGLKNIRSRVEYLQGEFEIDSSVGVGSHFFVRVGTNDA